VITHPKIVVGQPDPHKGGIKEIIKQSKCQVIGIGMMRHKGEASIPAHLERELAEWDTLHDKRH